MCNELNRRTNVTIAHALLGGPPRRRPPDWQGLRASRWPEQQRAVAAFVSNCVGWRLEYLRELRRHVRVESFGGCLHNNDSCAKSGPRKCDKVALMRGAPLSSIRPEPGARPRPLREYRPHLPSPPPRA